MEIQTLLPTYKDVSSPCQSGTLLSTTVRRNTTKRSVKNSQYNAVDRSASVRFMFDPSPVCVQSRTGSTSRWLVTFLVFRRQKLVKSTVGLHYYNINTLETRVHVEIVGHRCSSFNGDVFQGTVGPHNDQPECAY
jgi:hypothetical protein